MLHRMLSRTQPVALELPPTDAVLSTAGIVPSVARRQKWLEVCRSGIERLIGLPALWSRRRCESYQLLTMDHRELRDVGLSSSQGYDLGNRPFWRP